MPPQDVDPDEALLFRAGQGDAKAIRTLVFRKSKRILSLAGRILGDTSEAEDVAQEAFLRIWRISASWRSGGAKFDTWLHRVVLNLCYDKLRRRTQSVQSVQAAPEQFDDAPGPEQNLQARDIARSVEEELQRLPIRQREAITLCHYQEMSNIRAAEVMGISVDALESLLARARRTLRSAFAGQFTNEQL